MNHDHQAAPQPNDDELRQQLLELHYGLLDADETAEIKQRIDSDPHVASLWAETLVVADKFALAARIDAPQKSDESPKIDAPAHGTPEQGRSEQGRSKPRPSGPTAPAASTALPPTRRGDRFLKLWMVSLASAATLAIAICGVRYWSELPPGPAAEYHIAIEPVSGSAARSRNEFLVVLRPTTPDRSPRTLDSSLPIVPATISFRVLSKGAVLFLGSTQTSTAEPARIQVPDNVVIPDDAVLHIDATPSSNAKASIRLEVPLEPTRCLTFLTTDRPVYRPGESIFYRSVTLNRRTLAAHLEVPIRYELLDPSGASVAECLIEGVTERGVGNGVFAIPAAVPGGTYKLVAKSLDGFFPDQTCPIEIRQYRAVKLKTDLEFSKRSYAAGDHVEADLVVRRADDAIPTSAPVNVKAMVDGTVVHQASDQLNDAGELSVAFDLPSVIRQGEGTLAIVINDGSVVETASRPIPIHTGRLNVSFFPEGGYLVGGLDNRVYFSAQDLDGNPIEVAGEVMSQAGRVVAEIETVRDGMGRFRFTPEVGQRYSLRVTSPLDITETPWLPSVVESLPVMDTGTGVFDPGQPLSMNLRSTSHRQCLVRAVCRGELVGVRSVELATGDNQISLPIQERAAGVIRVTVLDTVGETASPLVERLVYRRGEKALNIRATVDEGNNIRKPGESVRMTISVMDENDQPVPGAVLGVRVVDDAALSLRQQESPSIKTHFMLTSEVQSPEDLEHANFYLSDAPEAVESLDLLLGTQGWRRFISGSPERFEESFRESLVRLLELDGPRGGEVAQTKTNDDILAREFRKYRLQATAIWNRFVTEVRWILIVIGALWLIGFLFRPRHSSAVAAGVLLLAFGGLLQLGCGAGAPMDASPSASSDAGMESAYSMEEEAMDLATPMAEAPEDPSGGEMSGMQMAMGAPGPSTGPPSREDQLENGSFASRVVNYLVGRGGDHSQISSDSLRLSQEQLDRLRQARGVDAKTLADQLMEQLRFPIRQYAHVHRRSEDGLRKDFAETLLWNPMMVTDSTGTASIRFDLSDSLTLFRVQVDGHTSDGRLGSGGGSVVTRTPLQVDAKLPLEVTGGDRIDLPVGLVNATDSLQQVDLTINLDDKLQAEHKAEATSIAAAQRTSHIFPIEVTEQTRPVTAKLRVAATLGEALSDGVERSIRIVPSGFPFEVSRSGTLNGEATPRIPLPDAVVAGSLSGTIQIYPNTRSQLSAGMDSILREPHGCFEQASASNYPNVMIFQLLQLEGAVDESMRKRTESLLRRGYGKLMRYECSDLGYEWFGNDPGHEALSAFGLMQFSEMAKVIDVDAEMLQRTRRWLLKRRDGQGGFQRNPRHLHVWSVQQDVVNAYLLWALSQADSASGNASRTSQELTAELDRMQRIAMDSEDAYLIALSAITLGNVGRDEAMQPLLKKLASLQAADGSLTGATSITQSGGLSLKVETTALAIMAWSRTDFHASAIDRAAKWLINHRRGGGFGSTQATILALKALVTIRDRMGDGESGAVDLIVDGKHVDTLQWQDGPDDGVTFDLPAEVLSRIQDSPVAEVTLRGHGNASLPFCIRMTGRTRSPESDRNCPVKLAVAFDGETTKTSVPSGESINVIATITNASDEGQPMTVAMVGLPGGVEPNIEGLDKMRDDATIDFYELRGRQVVLYWRTLAPREKKRIAIPCVAQIGGRYSGPPSSVYLYYTAESKTWHEPLVAEIHSPRSE